MQLLGLSKLQLDQDRLVEYIRSQYTNRLLGLSKLQLDQDRLVENKRFK